MKVAIVHDFLCQFGGAERVLKVIHEIYPDAPIYTLYFDPAKLPDEWKNWDIRPATLARYLPFKRKFFRHYFPLYPIALEQFDLRDYDLVISSSYLFAKSVITTPYTCHISYCHTPMRQAWDLYIDYKNTYARMPFRTIYSFLFHYMRIFDVISANRVDYFIANSRYVQARIKKIYRRESEVIYPPVNIDDFYISDGIDSYYLCLSRLVPYKRIDLAIKAFNKTGQELVVIGDGPWRGELKKIAKKNIHFVGQVGEEKLKGYLSRCRALIYPSVEDFGLAVLEAQASGRPAIVYQKGGAKEGIVENLTGVVFKEPTPESIIEAVKKVEKLTFDPHKVREHARKFSCERFKTEFAGFVNTKLEEYRKNIP